MATPTNCEPALESELPQYWEFSCSINTSIDSALRSQNSKSALLNQKSEFARLINRSVKHRWPSSYILLKIKTRTAKPGLDVCGIIRTSAAIDVNDLQTGITRQAKRVDKDFNTEDPGVIKLNILKEDFDAGEQAYNFMNEYTKAAASYGGDLEQFIKLAFVCPLIEKVIIDLFINSRIPFARVGTITR